MTQDSAHIAILLVAGLLGLWTAVACRRAHRYGLSSGDAPIWAGLSPCFC